MASTVTSNVHKGSMGPTAIKSVTVSMKANVMPQLVSVYVVRGTVEKCARKFAHKVPSG